MENKVYTQNELKAQNIITMDYVLNLEPGEYVAVLDLKAQARNCLRVFFTFEDGRKIMAAAQWWQRYLGFMKCPSERICCFITRRIPERKCISMPWSRFNRYCLTKQRILGPNSACQGVSLRPRTQKGEKS